MSAGYQISSGAVTLTAATAKTVANIIAAADAPVRLTELAVSFNGIVADAVPCLVELCASTQATAGTAGSSPTPTQIRGRARTTAATAGINYSAEPTVLTVLKAWYVPIFNGLFVLQYPLGREPESTVAASTEGLVIRCTAPAAATVRVGMEFEEG